jgi:transposase
MDTIFHACAGLDVHKKTVVACRRTCDPVGKQTREVRTFSTMTADLILLRDWLREGNCTHVAMESTGQYWKPVYNILESDFELLVVNAQHVKTVPGRKTDVKDAEWLAQLLQHGLLRGSFIPPLLQRALRELTRHRTNFIQQRTTVSNRIQAVMESANIKFASVASRALGASGRAILHAIVDGEEDPETLARMAKGRLREKHAQLLEALEGRVQDHHRVLLRELLDQFESVDACIARLSAEIKERCAPQEGVIELLETIPGVGRQTAELIIAEVGTDMSRFPTAGHLASWAGVAPGNNESAGKRLSGRISPGNRALRAGLTQAAHAVARTKGNYLATRYRQLAARKGKKRATIAVAHSMLVSIYHMIDRGEAYQDLGPDYLDRLREKTLTKRMVSRLEGLGYGVALKAGPGTVASPSV